MIVVPDRRRAVVIGILERGEARSPHLTIIGVRLSLEEVVPRALGRIACGDVGCRRQVPGLGVAVALVADAYGAVDMRDDRDRTCVWTGSRLERRARVSIHRAARGVCPVQGLIHGQQVRQIIAIRVHQLVDPFDACGPVPLRFDGERGGIEDQPDRLARSPGWARSPRPSSTGMPAGRICCWNWRMAIS